MPSVSQGVNFDKIVLAAQKVTGGVLLAADVHLFVNSFTPNKVMLPADFTPPTYDGYAEVSLVGADWTDPYLNGAGNWEISTLAQVEFESTGTTVADMIQGYAIIDGTGILVRLAERFPAPVPIGVITGDRLGLILRLVLGATGLDGSAVPVV